MDNTWSFLLWFFLVSSICLLNEKPLSSISILINQSKKKSHLYIDHMRDDDNDDDDDDDDD